MPDFRMSSRCLATSSVCSKPLSITLRLRHRPAESTLRRVASGDYRRASAPPTMSINSFVMAAWRVLLYCSVSFLISSPALRVAPSMAAIRAARLFTGKKKVIKAGGAYHGWSDSMVYGLHIPGTGRREAKGIPRAALNDAIPQVEIAPSAPRQGKDAKPSRLQLGDVAIGDRITVTTADGSSRRRRIPRRRLAKHAHTSTNASVVPRGSAKGRLHCRRWNIGRTGSALSSRSSVLSATKAASPLPSAVSVVTAMGSEPGSNF